MSGNTSNGGFEVREYSIGLLLDTIAEKSGNGRGAVSEKLHAQYFEEYFEKLAARTILIETRYVDRDSLEDFSAYYVRCFSFYERFCTRFHFFTSGFSEGEFAEFLSSPESSELSLAELHESYLGFVVIKPLPGTFIGRTCLATYPSEGKRYFPSVREYSAHPFGLSLTVKSLAFQEQDSVVAACATSALWSTFHGTGKRFQHPIPSPVEITRSATREHPLRTRVFPNHGLEASMMAHAIKDIGLEPYYVQINANQLGILKETAYAYLQCQIPVVLIFELWDQSEFQPTFFSLHAVSVAGFCLGDAEADVSADFSTRANRITKLYAHDDQVGPFARMEFDGKKIQRPLPQFPTFCETTETLSTSMRTREGTIGGRRVVPMALLIPLYHKIRIPYASIHEAVRSFDCFIKLIVDWVAPSEHIDLEWDIGLTTGTDIKQHILQSDTSSMLPRKARSEILCGSFPRFLWKASAYRDGNLQLDLLFDATDIEHGEFFVRAIEWEPNMATFLRAASRTEKAKLGRFDSTETRAARKIIAWFRTQQDLETP